MREFVKQVVKKLPKLTSEQVQQLFDSLSEENEKLDSVLESLSTGLLICDENWNLLQANKAAERYLPFKQRSGTEHPVWTMIDDEEISAFLYDTWKRQRNNVSEEFTLETSSGLTRIVTVSAMPLVQKKSVTGAIIKIDDVTEKRNQETLLRRMESLASLTNLAASVAHEIKNPLGSISIHIQLVQKAVKKARSADGTLPDEKFVEKYLDIVTSEIERLNKIIVDFLFAVRPVNAVLEPVNPSELITDLAEFFRPELERADIDLQLNLLENSPRIMLDVKLFKQVVINLVQNSIAAMPSGGLLWISTQIKNDSYIIDIADTGEGMPEETLRRVFEPYFTTKANGTGLGLTMVYKIIKELGGDIDVQSFPEEGTLFIISLPVPQKEKRLLEYNRESAG